MLFFDQLPGITGGQLLAGGPEAPSSIEHLLLDSRRITVPATSLFFAIRGQRHDGHRFLTDLHRQGVRQFVVEAAHPAVLAGLVLPGASVLAVPDPVLALQAVAAHHRRRFSLPVVGITGSNGKTIVKEWLATLLAGHYRVAKSPRSYNSQVGVPLSVWQLDATHTFGIFEAGISQPGEMERLEAVIQPTIGIFTNIGTAHDEGFASRQQKIAEKAKLFRHCRAVVYCHDHADIHAYLDKYLPPQVQRWSWGKTPPQPFPFGEGPELAPLPFGEEPGEGFHTAQTYGAPSFHSPPEKWKVLKEFARQNRKNQTQAEDLLWQQLREGRLAGFRFRRQHAIQDFIVDFVCLEKQLVVEVDGPVHAQQAEYDRIRTEFLNAGGFRVMRFKNEEVMEHNHNVLTAIREALLASVTPPQPLPFGEGLGWGFSTDTASIENLAHCLTLMRHLGISEADIQAQVRRLQPVSMRLELKQGNRGCHLIDDTYNNDLAGLHTALDFLASQRQRDKKTVVLSDLLESGQEQAVLYQKIADMLHSRGVARLVGIGPVISSQAHVFPMEKSFYPDTETFLAKAAGLFSHELILVKGARTFRFERIVRLLQQKTHGTVLEINLDALAHNLNHYRSRLQPHTKLMAMVKAFAYGSGSAEIAGLLQFHRVDYLAVAYADEGVLLRENGITLPVMVMNPAPETFAQLIDHQLEPEIYSLRLLHQWVAFTEENDQTARIHLKLETGMNRLGFDTADLPELIQTLRRQPRLRVAAVFSHLAAADAPRHRDFTRRQIGRFEAAAAQISGALGYQPLRHIVNSAGIAHFPEAQYDMVRLGIGLYGVGATESEQTHLRTVGTLKTVISQIKHVAPGETVGYGRRGVLPAGGTTATIAIGYADGFDRRFSLGAGRVWVNGHLAPVVGSVCMDMTMIDITGIEAREGDEVIVFGEALPVQQLAQWAGTIPYELMTGIGERVKRVFFTE